MVQHVLFYRAFKQPDGKKIWDEYAESMKARESEILETLRNESVYIEACFKSPDDKGVYYFIQVEDLEKAYEKFQQSSFPIDKEHAEMLKRCFDPEASKQLENTFVFLNPQGGGGSS